jgi:HSP20 family protein
MAEGPSDKPDFFGQLVRHLDRHMGGLFRGSFLHWPPGAGWRPPVNLYETADRYMLCMDLAGVDYRQLDVQVTGTVLTIRGRRKDVTPTEPVKVHAMELDHGEFSRDVEFPEPVQRERVQAGYKDGLLWIELPKKSTDKQP